MPTISDAFILLIPLSNALQTLDKQWMPCTLNGVVQLENFHKWLGRFLPQQTHSAFSSLSHRSNGLSSPNISCSMHPASLQYRNNMRITPRLSVLTPQRKAVNTVRVFFPLSSISFDTVEMKFPMKLTFFFLVTVVCGLSFHECMTFVGQATGDQSSIQLSGDRERERVEKSNRKDQMKNNAWKWINTETHNSWCSCVCHIHIAFVHKRSDVAFRLGI